MKAIKKELLFKWDTKPPTSVIKTILVTKLWLTSSSVWAFWLFTVCSTEDKDYWNMVWLLSSCLVFSFHCSPPKLNFPAKLVYHSNQHGRLGGTLVTTNCLKCAQYQKKVSKFFEKTFLHSFKLKSFRDSRGRHYINTCIIFF